MKNISFIITLFFIVSLSSLEKISAQPYTIKRLGMEDGLSSNYTQKIIQDQKGYIWVATSSGLNRFDGQNSFFMDKTIIRQSKTGSTVC